MTQVREILASSGTQVEVEIARDSSSQGQSQGTRLTKSESLRIFRAVPSSPSWSSSQQGEARVRTSDY